MKLSRTSIFILTKEIRVHHFREKKEKNIFLKFWYTVKPFLSDKIKSRESITIVEKDKIMYE